MLFYYVSMIESGEDQRKFARLYENYKYTMMYAASQILHDQFLAEDAIHQAFLKIINNLEKIDESNVPKTKAFLVIIARNTAKDIYCEHYGRKDDDKEISLEDVEDLSDVYHERSVESQVMEQYDINKLVKTIEALPEIYSDISVKVFSRLERQQNRRAAGVVV
ncbi:Sigma-70 region 2 [[Clostridium] methylpentosum DSM 5476]|uniref:Sigma-70 region 2 n=1 Tax=[Clostridium] methylpentosum DSM 5476 TaxID=537013 RepID=C0EGE2_9FIRM|nr:Sigma-70 region 2 [[Clostridium] methylpentosum DSM 5476]